MSATEPVLLTVREATKLLRISADLAYALVWAGVLPVLRLGERRVVIPREALLKWIASPDSGPTQLSWATVGGVAL